MIVDRRFFLKSSGLAVVATGVLPGFLRRAAAVTTSKPKKVLVVVFQRGAMDGLNAVVPYSDDRYYQARPTLAIRRPGNGDDGVLDLDGQFGLHPALTPLKRFWDEKSLAIIHAAGSPDSTRSHFDAQDFMESATPGDKGTRDGWLSRYLETHHEADATPLRSVSIGSKLPRSLQGSAGAVAINRLSEFSMPRQSPVLEDAFRSMYEDVGSAAKTEGLISKASGDTFAALELVKGIDAASYRPANNARYPRGELGDALRQVAQMIKADVGVEVAFIEMGGWDTHAGQAPRLNGLLGQFGGALAAFAADLGSRLQDVVVLTMSEFGRTARENGNRGTDHGHANAMFALGGNVEGGKIYGKWPGLGSDQLFEGRDLALTTDFRDVFAEVLSRHMQADNLKPVFPNFTPRKKNFRGFVKA